MKRVHHLVALGLLGALLAASSAQADSVTYSFVGGSVTNNDTANASSGSQFEFTVIDAGSGQVSFVFTNTGPVASSITDIYFDDAAGTDQVLAGIASISLPTSDVSFSADASPPNLPGSNFASPDFEVTAGLSADSTQPVQILGINPGESLTITFTLASGMTFDDVLTSLANGVGTYIEPALRVGIHVQGYTNGGSESFVDSTAGFTKTPPEAPLPPVAVAGIALMGGLGGLQRLRKRVGAA